MKIAKSEVLKYRRSKVEHEQLMLCKFYYLSWGSLIDEDRGTNTRLELNPPLFS